ncbi:hypothetical protein J1N35_043656, partial [Gossypium stocksii]
KNIHKHYLWRLQSGLLQETNNYHKAKVTSLKEAIKFGEWTIVELHRSGHIYRNKIEHLNSCIMA